MVVKSIFEPETGGCCTYWTGGEMTDIVKAGCFDGAESVSRFTDIKRGEVVSEGKRCDTTEEREREQRMQ